MEKVIKWGVFAVPTDYAVIFNKEKEQFIKEFESEVLAKIYLEENGLMGYSDYLISRFYIRVIIADK